MRYSENYSHYNKETTITIVISDHDLVKLPLNKYQRKYIDLPNCTPSQILAKLSLLFNVLETQGEIK